jgi:hypothetical protein
VRPKQGGNTTETSVEEALNVLYAAKCYWPDVTQAELERAAAHAATDTDGGYLGSLLFPGDKLVLCLFDATRAAVQSASDRAGIPCERVMESLWLAPSKHPGAELAPASSPPQASRRRAAERDSRPGESAPY